MDGSPITSRALEGRMVLLDFWATWCGPCMAQADHMVAINNEYGPKGLAIIGISLDRGPNPVIAACRQKGFTWPQVLDRGLSRQFGVNGIPHAFLISPDGAVVWTGHPAQLDKPLAAAFEKYPPRLEQPATQPAPKARPKLPTEADKAELEKQLAAKAADALTAAQKLQSDGKHEQAYGEFKNVVKRFARSDAAAAAAAAIAKYEQDPQFMKKIAEGQGEAKAASMLSVAANYRDAGDLDHARERYRAVIEQFPDSAAARTAKKELAGIKE